MPGRRSWPTLNIPDSCLSATLLHLASTSRGGDYTAPDFCLCDSAQRPKLPQRVPNPQTKASRGHGKVSDESSAGNKARCQRSLTSVTGLRHRILVVRLRLHTRRLCLLSLPCCGHHQSPHVALAIFFGQGSHGPHVDGIFSRAKWHHDLRSAIANAGWGVGQLGQHQCATVERLAKSDSG